RETYTRSLRDALPIWGAGEDALPPPGAKRPHDKASNGGTHHNRPRRGRASGSQQGAFSRIRRAGWRVIRAESQAPHAASGDWQGLLPQTGSTGKKNDPASWARPCFRPEIVKSPGRERAQDYQVELAGQFPLSNERLITERSSRTDPPALGRGIAHTS